MRGIVGKQVTLFSNLSGKLPLVTLLWRSQRLFKNQLANLHAGPKGNRKMTVIDHFQTNLPFKSGMYCWSSNMNPYPHSR